MKNKLLTILLTLFITMQLFSCDSANKKDMSHDVIQKKKQK